MKITGFEIEHFGLWRGLAVNRLEPGVNVFYGANEAGKSTVMDFIRSQLYGFNEDRKRYLKKPSNSRLLDGPRDPDSEGELPMTVSGGLLNLDCPSGTYRLERKFDPKRIGNEEEMTILAEDGEKKGTQLLRVLVSGIDEATFNNVFAIGLDELQRLGTLSDTEAAEMLFRLSVGMDRVSIVEAIRELNRRRNRILDITGIAKKASLLQKLTADREKILEAIASAKLLVRDYARIRTEQRGIERDIAQLESELAETQRERRLYEIALNAAPIWKKRDKIRNSIAELGNVQTVSAEIVNHLNAASATVNEKRTVLEHLKTEYKRAVEQIKATPVDELLLKLTPKLEVLLEEESRIIEIDEQITVIENEIAANEKQVRDAETQLKRGRRTLTGSAGESGTASDPTPSPIVATPQRMERPKFDSTTGSAKEAAAEAELLGDYRTPARNYMVARQRLKRTKEQYAELQGRAKILNDKVESELSKRNVTDLSEAVERASDKLTNLRRRQGLTQRLTEMSAHHRELYRVNTILVQNQALPTLAVVGLAVAGIIGAVPIGLEIFKMAGIDSGFGLPPLLSVLGGIVLVGSFVVKIGVEKSRSGKLKQNQRQLSMLISQLEQVKQEAAAIDAKFPASVGSANATIENRVQESQLDLATLEKLIPVDAQRREVNQQFKAVEQKLQRCKEEYSTTSRRWNDYLKYSGLPADWTPNRVRDLKGHYDTVGGLRKELDYRYEMMNQRIREMRTITDRIDKAIAEAKLTFADGMSYVDILVKVRQKLADNDVKRKHRLRLKSDLKEMRKMRKKALFDLRKAKINEFNVLRPFGAKSPEHLKELYQLSEKHRMLTQQEQGSQREIDAAIGKFCDEKVVTELLNPLLEQERRDQMRLELLEKGFSSEEIEARKTDADREREKWLTQHSLDQRLKTVCVKIDAVSTQLKDELEDRGRLAEQLKTIAEDKTVIKKQRELAIVDEKIRQAKLDWQIYAASSRILDLIRATYERERQPRTLAEASELLKQLTDGRYVRIWTPLGEEALLVDDAEGNTFDLSWLSRGTREQLFIALRFALISAFAQLGVTLPLVLDDVLVNFDSKRAFAAAKVLMKVAETGRQIFLFTCHEHVCRIFQRLEFAVRILPPINEPTQPIKILLPLSILKERETARKEAVTKRAAEREKRRIEHEIKRREAAIRRETLRKAEIQRLVVQMQQQATAEKVVEERETSAKRSFAPDAVSAPNKPKKTKSRSKDFDDTLNGISDDMKQVEAAGRMSDDEVLTPTLPLLMPAPPLLPTQPVSNDAEEDFSDSDFREESETEKSTSKPPKRDLFRRKPDETTL